MHCPKCKSSSNCKHGFALGKQRYWCKHCGYKFTTDKVRGEPKEKKDLALKMYLEGLGFRAISRIVEVSHVSVFRWIRDRGELPRATKLPSLTPVVEMDEMHSFVGLKKNRRTVDLGSYRQTD